MPLFLVRKRIIFSLDLTIFILLNRFKKYQVLCIETCFSILTGTMYIDVKQCYFTEVFSLYCLVCLCKKPIFVYCYSFRLFIFDVLYNSNTTMLYYGPNKWPLHTCYTCLHSSRVCCLVGFIHCVYCRHAKFFPLKKLTCNGCGG